MSAITLNTIHSIWSNSLKQPNKKTSHYPGLPSWLNKIAAVVILLLLSPLLLITALLIRLESRGNIIFKQYRVGQNGRFFTMYKFRSMYLKQDKRYRDPSKNPSDREGVCKKYVNDPRITKVGWVIRKLSIDELPQLINVINGDMYLVGPRPALPTEVQEYTRNHYSRLNCQPGLTGLWQVSGRADTTFEEQIILDKLYIENRSIWLDFKILLMTIPAVLLAKGAY